MKDELLVTFGQHVRRIRESKNISQEDLANLAGIGRSYYGRVERGEKNIGLLLIYRIAKALDVPAKELIP